MSIDWNALAAKCSGFRSLTVTKDPDTGTVLDAVFGGFRVNLSEVLGQLPQGGASGLSIFADTLVIDAPSLDARGAAVLARNIDTSQLRGSPMPLRIPASDSGIAEFIVGGTTGGALRLTTLGQNPAPAYTVPVGQQPLQTVYYTVSTAGQTTSQVTGAVADLADMITRPWALTSFQASFTAAALLADSDDAASQRAAADMLNWVVACIRAVSAGGAAIPGSFSELYSQAAALLVTVNVASGAYYVPVLSSGFYKDQVDALLGALQSYENNLNTLTIRTDVSQAVKDVSATLGSVAQAEMDPLNTELNQVQQNIDGLADAIGDLSRQFFLQYYESRGAYGLLVAAIYDQLTSDWLNACFSMGMSTVSLSVAVGKAVATDGAEADGVGDAVKGFADSAKGMYDAIDALRSGVGVDTTLLDQSAALMRMQQALMTSFQSGAILWAQAQKSAGAAPDLPRELSAVSVDPGLAWDNYMARAEAALSGLSGADVQQPAKDYLASLKILAQYGKAIDVKMIAYSSQLARGVVLKAQIAASMNVMALWADLENKASSDQERLAALKGVIQLRANSIKRSIYVSWTYYRNSYFYLYFQKPPFTIGVDMNAAQLKDAFASVSGWIAQLLGDDPGGQRVTLPSNNVHISFTFQIVKSGQTPATGAATALFSPATGNGGPTLTWTIPAGSDQLKGVLPQGGNVAIWITEAKFFVDGVTRNAKGNVIMQVATSGSYQNGFGPSKAFSFVTKSLGGYYAYTAPANVYDPWSIDSSVYQMPTPFTQWTATFDPDGGDPSTATALRMELTVAYKGQS